MNNYMQRLSLTAWRRKNTILVVAALLSLILFGLQYSVIEENNSINEERDAKVVEDALLHSIKVKFIEAANLNRPASTQTSQILKSEHLNQNSVLDRQTEKDFQVVESEQQLGIPYINIDTRNPYVPKQRLVHFDLKGAPLTLTYFRKVIPLVKHAGATGILLEYEDMFPYKGVLQSLAAKNAYTVDQVKEILRLIEDAKMDVIPLVQTFGHMEFALKHIDFQNIREVPGSPQSLCPSRNSSLDFIRELVEQVLDLHPKIKYLHIGCDEVFEMGECELCRLEMHETLFLRHVQNVANIVREIKPDLQVIIWDDMLRHLSQQSMQAMNLGNLVEPMIWVYAEDIYRFVQPPVWDKYSAIFKTAWTASAFKGAFGETVYIPNARRHLENNLHWLDVMATQSGVFKKGISGIVLTGWQRYDHFAVLCELLPASLPSLVINLITVSHGFFNSSLKNEFLTTLSCPQPPAGRAAPFINLESDPHMWDKLARCMFPGHGFFKFVLHSKMDVVKWMFVKFAVKMPTENAV
ncbi:hexosaminidase D-like isoform X2 [Cylas formicarius]|uniref:hexosaminidase D-like isoform X2 n=1 Tax=Cylas formicarius TaxID=197179 RepID=UPI002958CF4D|nr:hexosaminidase D-like isoform X2 [Cylas formicarius]